MRIKYLANVRVPTSRAHGFAIMKMCEEFANAGTEVELVVPGKGNNENKDDPFEFYKIEKKFTLTKIKIPDLLNKTLRFGRILFWLDLLIFLLRLRYRANIMKGDVVYTRDYTILSIFSRKHFIVLELHDIPSLKFLFKMVIKKPKIFVVISEALKRELIKLGIEENRIFVFRSGVGVEDFQIETTQEEARRMLELPNGKKLVVYTGQLYNWKGGDVLAHAASLLPESNFVFVGGIEPELSEFNSNFGNIPNIIIRPFTNRTIIPFYLRAADVLVIPNSAKATISVLYTSPLKLFEYLASGKPIVASRLPSIMEVVSEKECLFAEPDDPESIARSIKAILSDKNLAETISRNGYMKSKQYSWANRARGILDIMKIKSK